MNFKAILVSTLLCMAAPMFTHQAVAQTSQTQGAVVNGTVYDELGEPVIGATIRVKGNKDLTAITDMDGNFSIKAGANGVIEVSYIGYKTQTIPVNGRDKIEVNLAPSAEALDEVVVVGYGTQKKESLTGAITQIKGDEVYKGRGTTNTATALQGEIAGLTVTRSSSRPGSEGAAMQIRGAYSINGDSSPLILIDGQAASLDELNQMDGNDIANISVLKDASAAIYGARSAGGVILVTTKRGQQGKPQVTYSGSYSRTIDGIQIPLTTNYEWLDMFTHAKYNDAKWTHRDYDHDQIMNVFDYWIFGNADNSGTPVQKNPETGAWEAIPGAGVVTRDGLIGALMRGETLTLNSNGAIKRWEPNNYLLDALYGDADTWKHNVSIAGGDAKFNYRASANYSTAQSQLKVAEDGEKKYGIRLNADYNPTDLFKIETGMSYERRDITTPSQGIGRGWQDPWFWAFRSESGKPYDTFSRERNPIGWFEDGGETKNRWTTFRANGKVTFDFSQWVKGLSLVGSAAYKRVQREETIEQLPVQFYDWADQLSGSVKNSPASLTERNRTWESYTLGAFIYYNNKFGKHGVDVMLGLTGENEDYKNLELARRRGEMYPGSGLSDLNVFVGGDNNTANGGKSSWSFLSWVGDVRYNFADRYLISLLGRRDGSSRLTPANRWKNFYSASAGWVFTNEEFFKSLGIDQYMNFGKIRYDYGKTGALGNLGDYEAYSTISTGSVYLGSTPVTSMWINGMRSDDRTWETIDSHDFGVDFGFFNNRLRATFDYFSKTNNGMFIDVTYPSVLGAAAPKTNNGKLRTKGWEVEAKWTDRIGNVNYYVGFNVFDAKTKVLTLTNNENVPEAGINRTRLIGHPLNAIYVYQTDGIFQNQEEVDAYYEMYYWNADHTGPKVGNVLPAPNTSATNTLRPGARKRVDINGDGVITRDDIYYAGDTAPRLSFGIKGGFEWKGIDLSFFFQGVGRQTVLRTGNLRGPFCTNWTLQNNTYTDVWSESNPNAKYTILSFDGGFNSFNYDNSDVAVQNNRYIRLKNLVVGYTLPRAITSKACIEKMRVYFSGDDLWEWTKIKDGYDPEHGEGSNNIFPFSRMLNFGLELTF